MLYRLENLQRKHGNRTVLNIENLEIGEGQIYTLIGPNGAGKTSLLTILSFLDRPTSGRIHFLDKEVAFGEKNLFNLRRQVVLLDQTPIMFTGSVWQNVEFGLRVRKVAAGIRRTKVQEALELVGMEKFADYDARGLSGGETKRVALARAVVLDPKVLLCDEPTANVDNENQEIILKIIEKINKERRCSVIFSTHYLSQGQRLADQTLLLQNGSLSDIISENIYRMKVVDRQEDHCVCQLTGQFFLSLPLKIIPENIQVAKLHIDPSGLIFNPDGRKKDKGQKCNLGDQGNVLSGHITDLSQQSGRVRVVVNVGITLVVLLSMEQYRLEKPGIGDKVEVLVPHRSVRCNRIELT